MKINVALAVLAASISTMVNAQTERDLDSHEHGAANMNIAIDQGSVFLELETPWNNMVGFEHKPRTEEQHKLVDDALALLNDPGQLFSFSGTNCSVTGLELEDGLAEGGDHDDHHDDEHAEGHGDEHHDDKHDDEHAEGHGDEHHDDHHDDEHAEGHGDEHHDDKHDDEHAEGHGDEHHDDEHAEGHGDEHHDDHAGEGEVHSSMLATYTFACDDSSKLSAIDIKLLNVWSKFEDLDVQLIGPGGQAALELGQEKTLVDTTQVQ